MTSPQKGMQVKKRGYPRSGACGSLTFGYQGDEIEPANKRPVKSSESRRVNFTGN